MLKPFLWMLAGAVTMLFIFAMGMGLQKLLSWLEWL